MIAPETKAKCILGKGKRKTKLTSSFLERFYFPKMSSSKWSAKETYWKSAHSILEGKGALSRLDKESTSERETGKNL